MRTFRKSAAIDRMLVYYEKHKSIEAPIPLRILPPSTVLHVNIEKIELECGDIINHLDNVITKVIKQMSKQTTPSSEKSPVCCDICECDDMEFLDEYETGNDGATVLCAICAYETKAADPKEITFGGGAILS